MCAARRPWLSGLFPAILLLFPVAGSATYGDEIINPIGGGRLQIENFEPIGNTFVAEDELVTVGLGIEPINPGSDPTDPLVVEVYEGVGVAGNPLIYSQSFVPSPDFQGFLETDPIPTSLVIGAEYSVLISVDGDSSYWGLLRSQSGQFGEPLINGQPTGNPAEFNRFSMRIAPVLIPEPATGGTTAMLLAITLLRRTRASGTGN